MTLYVYSPGTSPRLKYILDFWCRELFQCDYVLLTATADYLQAPAPRLNYSTSRLQSSECFIPASGFLMENTIAKPTISVIQHRGFPTFFSSQIPDADLPFDLLAMSFYLLSRYEEYLDFEPDQHGRFTARQSLAFQNGFLQKPLLDLWALELKAIFQSHFPAVLFPQRTYRFLPTYDIDMAWAYLHKGIFRYWGGLVQSFFQGHWSSVWERLCVGVGIQADPFYTFDYMEEWHQKLHLRPLYFFLLGKKGVYDKNIDPHNVAFQQLIRQIHAYYPVGIHPSYGSNMEEKQLEKEKKMLEKIIGEPVWRSRQHYLKMQLPQTYRRLCELGIREEYTMGFAEDIGFRAGTCSPFYWYDLSAEKVSTLRLFPFAVMDVSLKQYLQYTPGQAKEALALMIEEVRRVGGTFCTLWHNSSLSETEGWEGWREVYEQLLQEARE